MGVRTATSDHPLATSNMDVELSTRSAAPPAHTPTPPAAATAPLQTFPATSPIAVKTASSSSPSPTQTLDDLADAFLAEMNPSARLRPPPLAMDLSDIDRLRALAERRAWGDVVTFGEQLLRGPSSHYAALYTSLVQPAASALLTLESQQEELCEILALQCHALVQLRRYSELDREIRLWTFLFPVNSHPPAWIPWSLHILAASTLAYTNGDATGALWKIAQAIPTDDLQSRMQVQQALSNIFVRQKKWRMAMMCLQSVLDVLPAACHDDATKETVYRCDVLSRQGRIFLQTGAITEASIIFQEADAAWKETHDKSGEEAAQIPAQLAVNEGLLCFASGQYDKALEFFRTAVQHLRKVSDFTVTRPYRASDWLGAMLAMESPYVLYSETMNNMSLCAIYTCRLQEAIHVMETLVREDPTSFLTERVALNLWCV